MIEEQVLEYIFNLQDKNLIESKDIPLMVSLLRDSYMDSWNPEIVVSKTKLSELLGVSRVTINSYFERMEFSGLISCKARSGYGTTVRINFIDDILSTKYLKTNSKKEIKKVMDNYSPTSCGRFSSMVFNIGNKEEKEENNMLNTLRSDQNNSKETLHPIDQRIKNFTNVVLVNVKKLTGQKSGSKEINILKQPKYKFSLHLIVDSNSFNPKHLGEISEEKYGKLRKFFSSIYIGFNKQYIKILNTIDHIFFAGKLTETIEEIVSNQRSTDSLLKRKDGSLTLNEETIHKYIPQSLQDYSEMVWGIDVSFIQAIEDWIVHLDETDNKEVTASRIKETIKYVSSINCPVKSIKNSIKKGWLDVYEYKEEKSNDSNPDYDPETGIATDGRYGQEITFEDND